MRREGAFTVVELLVVVVIIAILLTITVPAVGRYLSEGRKTKEITAARKIIASYLMYSSEHDGNLMAGYRQEEARDSGGATLSFPANARYPWRLAPYLDFDMHAILFNGNESALHDQVDFHYAASVAPNLGMNTTFVGGDYGTGSDLVPSAKASARYGPFCVTKLLQASKPDRLMVFVSARRGKKQPGFYQVKSPSFTSERWSGKWNPEAPAEAFGYVDLRYNDKAVAAMLDGHVEMLDEDGVKDMRHWSNQAAEQDDAKYSLTKK